MPWHVEYGVHNWYHINTHVPEVPCHAMPCDAICTLCDTSSCMACLPISEYGACMVHGAWYVHGAWCMVHGMCMVHGAWCMVHGMLAYLRVSSLSCPWNRAHVSVVWVTCTFLSAEEMAILHQAHLHILHQTCLHILHQACLHILHQACLHISHQACLHISHQACLHILSVMGTLKLPHTKEV